MWNFDPFFHWNLILWYSKHILSHCEGSQNWGGGSTPTVSLTVKYPFFDDFPKPPTLNLNVQSSPRMNGWRTCRETWGSHFLTYAFILDSSQSAMNEVSGIPRRSWWSTAFRFDSADNRDSFQPNHNLHFSTQPLFVFSTQYTIGFNWPKKAKRFVTTLKTDSKISQIWIRILSSLWCDNQFE